MAQWISRGCQAYRNRTSDLDELPEGFLHGNDSTHAFDLLYACNPLHLENMPRQSRLRRLCVLLSVRAVALEAAGAPPWRSTMALHYGAFPGLLHADTMQPTPRPIA